jgi:hypothetical protein
MRRIVPLCSGTSVLTLWGILTFPEAVEREAPLDRLYHLPHAERGGDLLVRDEPHRP